MIDYVNKDKENVIITFDEFINIEKQIQDMQCIFHPLYAVDGRLSINQVMQLKAQGKEIYYEIWIEIFLRIL